MTDTGVIYDVSETQNRWFISFRREDGSTGDLALDKPHFSNWYESDVGRSYSLDHIGGTISSQLQGRKLKFWYEEGKGYWALA
jgi:hypothetical protein